MASGPSKSTAREILDMTLSEDRDVRLWTVAPDFDGLGGTEVTGGGYEPAVLITAPATPGVAGQLARKPSSVPLTFNDMPVDSTAVVAISVHEHSTGDLVWLDDSWTSPVAWAAGESPQLPADKFAVAMIPVA